MSKRVDFRSMSEYDFDIFLTGRLSPNTGYWDVLSELVKDVLPEHNMDEEDIKHLIGPTLKSKLEAELSQRRMIKGSEKLSKNKLF